MKFKKFMLALQAIESDRNLSKEIVVEALQEALAKAFRKHIEIPDALVKVDVDNADGDIKVYQQRKVVEVVEDDELEMSLEDAKAIRQSYELGDLVEEEVDIAEFGRAAVILAKNVMKQKIREAEKQAVYDEYCDKVEEMVIGNVETVEEKFCIVNIGKTLAVMPKNQQIPGERYYEGQRLRVVISEVNKETKGAQVLVSRSCETLVKRLFEKEVPEIYQGVIEIKAIAREAGERTKMAVYSSNENVDPIGACIGLRRQRVQEIINELGGEKIDIFQWSEDITELIKNALSPAEVLAVIPSQDRKNSLLVVVNDQQLSLAIGKKGKNARLAVKLTRNKIDIKSQSAVENDGIDWKAISLKQQAEYAKRKEELKQQEQARIFQEANQENQLPVEMPEFEYNDTLEDAQVEEIEANVEQAIVEEKPKEESLPQVDISDLEEAAKEAHRRQKEEGVNLKEKQEYVSKFEQILDTKTMKQENSGKPKAKKEEEGKRKSTFDLSKRDYDFKPIYSQEELDEIARQEAEEAENDWINDDIDFDEYDKYYDEM